MASTGGLDLANRHYDAAEALKRQADRHYFAAWLFCGFGCLSIALTVVFGIWWLFGLGVSVVACSWLCDTADAAERESVKLEWRALEALREVHAAVRRGES